jgi:tRNA pseudouridine13 synthase
MAEKKRIKLENPTCKKEFAAQPMEFYMDKERECGIGLFRTDGLQGFSAVLKQRFSDFLVNEIDLDGNVIRLKNLEGKEPEKVAFDLA